MEKNTLGQRIAAERRKKGLSQRQLGEKLAVTDKAISKWENDGSLPDISIITSLSEIFGCSVLYLMTGEDKSAEESAPSEPPKEEIAPKRRKTWIFIVAAVAVVFITFAVLAGIYLVKIAERFQGIYINVNNTNEYYIVNNTTYDHYFVSDDGTSTLLESGSWFGVGNEIALGDSARISTASGSATLLSNNSSYERVSGTEGQNDNIDVVFVNGEAQTKFTVKRGSGVPTPSTPTKEGYAFAGWVSSETVEGKPYVYHDKDIQWRNVHYHATFTCVHVWDNDYRCIDAVCLRCGEVRAASITHVYADSHTCHDRTCLKCGHVDPASTEHTLLYGSRIEPTCTENGLQQAHCTGCGLIVNTVLPAKGHTVVVDHAYPATCTSSGWTEGSHCSVCEKVIVEQTYLPILGHLPAEEWIVDIQPSCKEASREEPDAGIGHRYKLCTVCGEVAIEEELDRLEHTPVPIPDKEATCTEAGHTGGSKCADCGKILEAPIATDPALGHTYDNEVCTRCGQESGK